MPKSLTEIRSLARSHTRTALNVLVAVMRNTKATPPARVAAANAILDRGWGKATQAIENGDDGALELIHRIERVIVHPENSDSQGLRAAADARALQGGVWRARLRQTPGVGQGAWTGNDRSACGVCVGHGQYLVVSFYFAKRGFENVRGSSSVSRIIKR